MSPTVVTPAGPLSVQLAPAPIRVERWPSERPLLVVSAIVSALIWLLAIVTVFGLLYALVLGSFFFVMHLAFIAHVRGSGVRLGADQFPALHARVEQLAMRMGMEKVPDAYLMQAGGSLNAFATRFLGTNLIVLFSDLLEACGDDEAARDMIIAHELGHVHAGHLRWHWFLLPSKLVPFLGGALSRAREYTCDRYGLAGAGDPDGAVLGMAILSAGGKHGPAVNRQALARQRADIDTGWMTIGEWFSSHPPLTKRIAELDPSLRTPHHASRAGTVRALGITGLIVLPLFILGWLGLTRIPAWVDAVNQQTGTMGMSGLAAQQASLDAETNMRTLATFLADEQAAGRAPPASGGELYERWESAHPGLDAPLDPFDGGMLGYEVDQDGFYLWSSGPDGLAWTEDDQVFEP